MTVLRCLHCHNRWTVHTRHANIRNTTHRICPTCIPLLFRKTL